MGNELQLTLLGKPGVTQDNTPVTGFAHRKSLALLYYLAVTGRPHSRESLAGLLWGESTEANARAGLRKSLADLRRLVAPHLTITRWEVAFNRARPYWLDVELFTRQAGEAMEARACEVALTDKEADALASAVELYQGDFLEGFYVRRAPAFEEWALLERERLRLFALRALHILAAHYTARGAYAQGIAYTDRVLAMEPGQEEAHRQMMSLLALTGQRGAALRQYRICRRVLKEEWGLEPEEETTTLYKRISDRVHTYPHVRSPPHNLPTPPLPLIGRETEVSRVTASLRDPNCRLLTLLGPGGSGKTRLAIEVALQLAKEPCGAFRHGLYLISLAPLRSVEAIVGTVAQSLGFHFYEENNPRRQLLRHLRRKDMLLILDNFDHLLGGVDLVSDILKAAPCVKILATSRVRLNVQAEHLYPVGGLDTPAYLPPPLPISHSPSNFGVAEEGWWPLPFSALSPAEEEGQPSPPRRATEEEAYADQYSAIQLFVPSAGRIRPDLELTPSDLDDVARICQLVEGMPLAILLAAAWMRILTPSEIAARLCDGTGDGTSGTGRNLDFLEADWRDVPGRQRSMRAVFDHSWNLLTGRERDVLAALSVFRGGFTHEAAYHVSGASLRELVALADQSLLDCVHPRRMEFTSSQMEQRWVGGRYRLQELLRQYAEEKLCLSPVTAKRVRNRHSRYFAARLQEWAAALRSDRKQAALAEMDMEIMNAQAAWDWAVAQGKAARVYQMMEGLSLFHSLHGRSRGGESACQHAVGRLTSATPLAQRRGKGEVDRIPAKTLEWQSSFSDPARAL
jgi:predicted ATPase/DNA-binding SARP family transcriptional activator